MRVTRLRSCVQERIGHGQMVVDANFCGGQRDSIVNRNCRAPQGFRDENISENRKFPKKEDFADLVQDDDGNEGGRGAFKIRGEQGCLLVSSDVFQPP